MKEETDQILLICACHSFDHQVFFWHENEFNDNALYAYFHLTTHKNFFQRLWTGLKYAFGYRSRFGAWDEFIFSEAEEKKLLEYLIKKHEKNGTDKTSE
jgi:hypothetical protein